MAGLNFFAFGCGRQSVAALVLAKQGILQIDAFIFANVGADSENPGTLRYFYDVALPYAKKHGINLVEVWRKKKDGKQETILGRILYQRSSIPLPARMNHNGAPGRRTCTTDFKVRTMAKWLKEQGATVDRPATMNMGISLDEYTRMKTESGIPFEKLAYPLIDLKLKVEDCLNIIASEGLPLPPRSACWFCPMHGVQEWRYMRDKEPGLFWMAAAIEILINTRRQAMGKDPVWLSYYRRPLAVAFAADVPAAGPDDEMCDSGYCMI